MKYIEITRNLHQEETPEPIMHDSYGHRIIPGSYIAFNRSGNVVLGNIVELKRSEWKRVRPGVDNKSWWRLKFELIVKDYFGNESIIKNPNSFVIIQLIKINRKKFG